MQWREDSNRVPRKMQHSNLTSLGCMQRMSSVNTQISPHFGRLQQTDVGHTMVIVQRGTPNVYIKLRKSLQIRRSPDTSTLTKLPHEIRIELSPLIRQNLVQESHPGKLPTKPLPQKSLKYPSKELLLDASSPYQVVMTLTRQRTHHINSNLLKRSTERHGT